MHHQLYCVDSPGSAGAQSWESGCALALEPVPLADESRSFVLPTKFLLQLQRGLCQASSGFPYKLQQGSSREVVPAHCCPERWEAPVAFLGWEGLWLEVSLPLSCSKQQRASLYWRKLWELAAEVWPSQLFLFCYRTKIWTDRSLSKCTYMSC